MGNEESINPDGETQSNGLSQVDNDDTKEVRNSQFPEDLRDDPDVQDSPNITNHDSTATDKLCPYFQEIIDESNSRLNNLQSSFYTKAFVSKALTNSLNSLNKSKEDIQQNFSKPPEEQNKVEIQENQQRLQYNQNLLQEAKLDFDRNQGFAKDYSLQKVLSDLKSANDTLTLKKKELDDLKMECKNLYEQFLNYSASKK